MAPEPTNGALTHWRAPVRYVEADAQGIVFNAHYLVYCDEALMAFLNGHGVDYAAMEAAGTGPRLVASEQTWRSSLRWGDVVEVGVAVEEVRRTSFVVGFHVHVEGRTACRVRTTYVMTDPLGTPVVVPEAVRALHLGS
jgi:acyl-CoA thioester hydrolase